MLEYLDLEIVNFGNIKVSIVTVIYIFAILATGFILDIIIRRVLLKFDITNENRKVQIEKAKQWSRLFLLFIMAILVLKTLGIDISRFLETKIINTENIKFSIYDLIIVLLILYGTKVLIQFIKHFLENQFKDAIDRKTGRSVYHISKYFVWIIAISIVLQTIGLDFKIILAGSAALLVGIGLGLQQIFNDMISGIFILFEGNLKIDDVVELENNTIGKVKEIGIRTSKIVTRDNIIMIIPNSQFVSSRVINWSHIDNKTRIRIDVGVSYDSDVEEVKRVLLECATEHNKVVKNPKPTVVLKEFGDSSVNFELMVWTTDLFRAYITKSDLRFIIFKRFKKTGITIPFPQRDLHIIKGEKEIDDQPEQENIDKNYTT